jgi:CheY-like chemotaxis protein
MLIKNNVLFTRSSVLIVDSTDRFRITVASMLKNLDFKSVYQARSGEEAQKLIDINNIDIIICNSVLPFNDGLSLLKSVRNEGATAAIPFIMMSADIDHKQVLTAIEHGVSDYVVKPFSLNILKRKIIQSLKIPFKLNTPLVVRTPPSSENNAKPVILVVDDIPDNIHIISELLKESYAIRGVTSGQRAVELCQKSSQPDLILLDIMMPGMDGMEVCEILKSDPLTQHITIVFLTALDDKKHIVRGLNLGAVDYITKPIQPEVAVARVRAHISTAIKSRTLNEQLDVMIEDIQRRDEFYHLIQNDLKRPLEEISTAITNIDNNLQNPTRIKKISNQLKLSYNSLSLQLDIFEFIYKIEDERYIFTPKVLDLNLLLSAIIEFHEIALQAKKLEIRAELISDKYIKAEQVLTFSLLASLLQNAIDAAPSGSAIEINVVTNNNKHNIFIINTGEIPKEIAHNFSDKYITQNKPGRMGIGAYAAKLMTIIQKGDFSWDTTIENKTSIQVSFPKK